MVVVSGGTGTVSVIAVVVVSGGRVSVVGGSVSVIGTVVVVVTDVSVVVADVCVAVTVPHGPRCRRGRDAPSRRRRRR
jgi:hypothetical protein